MSSPVGVHIADQLARWGLTVEMESFVSQLRTSCFHVTGNFPNLKLLSCTTTWSPHTNRLGQVILVCALAELNSCHVMAFCICTSTSASVTVQLLATRHQARHTVHISVQCLESNIHHILACRSASLPLHAPPAPPTPTPTPTPYPYPYPYPLPLPLPPTPTPTPIPTLTLPLPLPLTLTPTPTSAPTATPTHPGHLSLPVPLAPPSLPLPFDIGAFFEPTNSCRRSGRLSSFKLGAPETGTDRCSKGKTCWQG